MIEIATQDDDYWFKPKSHGYGATPTNWKGWLLVVAFAVWALVISAVFVVVPALNGDAYSATNFWTWLILLVVSVLALIFVSRAKTNGEWRWRWGDES